VNGNESLAVVILAAGLGKRMKSGLPKVLHEICGLPLIGYVLEASRELKAGETTVVVGNGADEVRAAAGEGPRFALQEEQKGTGHAVMVALEEMGPSFTEVLVLPGDAPLVRTETLGMLIEARRRGAVASLLSAELDEPAGYGRIIRGADGNVRAIVEEADATEEQRAITEVNSCTYVFDRTALEEGLKRLGNDNAQGEYYLTDVISAFAEKGLPVAAVGGGAEEVSGVNDRIQLAATAAAMRKRINDSLMERGVTLVDPAATYVDYGVRVGAGTVLMPMVFLSGDTRIGEACAVGPCTSIKDSTVDEGAQVRFSVLDGCSIGKEADVGPFSRLRPGTVLGEGSKAGSFVEMKETTVGRGSKVPHLSYVGDTTIGEQANVGAGSITCNYDGEKKHRTTIGDRAFIGSDTMLVAPVNVGNDASTGAGSVITEDVPDGSLAIERTRQKNVPGWKGGGKGKRRARE